MMELAVFLLVAISYTDAVNYRVTIHTGRAYWSGTGANVEFQLHGQYGSSALTPLHATSSQFAVGSVDTFTISTDKDLGKIAKIKLQHDGTGSHPGWFVNKVDVDTPSRGLYTFRINKWIDSSIGNSLQAVTEWLHQGNCGAKATSRVVNGADAKKNSWPWMVHLKFSSFLSKSYCGGTLIHPQYVLTAAHCLSKFTSPSSVTMTLGEHDRASTEGEELYVYADEYFIHSKYDDDKLLNDIALIKLQQPVILNDSIKLACLPREREHVYGGKYCHATGWGKLGKDLGRSPVLQEATLRTLSYRDCKYEWGKDVNDKHLCAKETRKGTCGGDSGGPLQCEEGNKFYVQGVTSFGAEGCLTSYASVFTRVTSYTDWIESVITSTVIPPST